MDVANTLQAFATMWTKPGERMMGSWSGGRRDFNSQDVANTL
jgi:hypothetical protein